MGVGELLVVLVVVLLVFGPGRLPEMMGNLGKAMREFQKGLREPPKIENTQALWPIVILVISVATHCTLKRANGYRSARPSTWRQPAVRTRRRHSP